MPPSNDDITNAIQLVVDGGPLSGTIVGATVDAWEAPFGTFADVWYYLAGGGSDTPVTITVTKTGGDANFFPSAFELHFTTFPPSSYDDEDPDDPGYYIPFCGDDEDTVVGSFVLPAGVTYYLLIASNSDDSAFGSFTIEATTASSEGDNVADAIDVPAGTTVVKTLDLSLYTTEADEFADGLKDPSAWFKIHVGGFGNVTVKVSTLTGCDDAEGEVHWYHAASEASAYSDLTLDGADSPWLKLILPTDVGFLDIYGLGHGSPGSTHGDLAPLVGGEWLYVRVSSDTTSIISIQVTNTAEMNCVDATTLINPDSDTASVVSGAVQEYQTAFVIANAGRTPDGTSYTSEIADEVATLKFTSDDVPDGPGLYSVYVKIKNDVSMGADWAFGLKRNGLPLHPPGVPALYGIDASGSTAVLAPITNWAGNDTPLARVNWLRGLPVFDGDEFELVVTNCGTFFEDAGNTIDITSICFQKQGDAPAGPIFDLLDMSDVPLGDSYGTWGQRTYTPGPGTGVPLINSCDICVTDDGKIWLLYVDSHDGVGNTFITGPVLKMWNGSSWTTISSNVSGLVTPNSNWANWFQNSDTTTYVVWGASMDTDGTDLFIAYGIWDGTKTTTVNGGGTPAKNFRIVVRKYSVGGASFSTLGSPFDGGDGSPTYANPQNGIGSDVPRIRVSPAGVPWVAFCDNEDTESGFNPGQWSGSQPAYVAHWTGSAWVVDQLPQPVMTGDDILDLRFISDNFTDRSNVDLVFRRLGDDALGETPAAIYQGSEEDDTSVIKQWIVYSEYNGSSWDKVFDGTIDDWVPDHLQVLGIDEGVEGHWAQGIAAYATPTNTYFAATSGFLLNGIDVMVCERLKEDGTGFDPAFSKNPPSSVSGSGYGNTSGFSHWSWDLHPKSMIVDARGNLWIGWWASIGEGDDETAMIVRKTPSCSGWHLAAKLNDGIGDTDFGHAALPLAMNPAGDVIYAAGEIFRAVSAVFSPMQLGVWECDVVEDAYYAELCPVGNLNMTWREHHTGLLAR